MRIGRFLSRMLGLSAQSHVCENGPMEGESIVLTEHSPNSAWIEIRGVVGRYVSDGQGRLKWEPRRG